MTFPLRIFTCLAVLLPNCSAANAPHPTAPNVVLITVDTLRADHVGCYGANQVQTPTLDALCRDGMVFERAFSQVPLTWPSHAAILTGTYPFQNGVQDFTGQPLSPQFHTVAEALKRHGYATGAVVSAFVLDRSWGLSRGFDYYDDAFSAEQFKKKEIGLVDRKAAESVSHAIAWLKRTPRRPFFLWLHLYDPHSPYDPPEPYFTQYKSHLYDGEIAYADHELGRLISWLKTNSLYDSSLIVFLSDHGESLGEHGEDEHGFFVYNSTIRIPLIVKLPAGRRVRTMRVGRPVETVALGPTLLQISGIKDAIQKQFQAPSLFANGKTVVEAADDTPTNNKLAGNVQPDAAYSETFYPFSSFGWSPLHSLVTSRYHYIDAPKPELYDISADPQEKNDLAASQPATMAVFKEKLRERLRLAAGAKISAPSAGLSADTLEKLRALGYVAYRSPVPAEALAAGLPDPKQKIGEFNSILKASDAFRAGDFQAAEALLAKVEEKEPQMYFIPFMLGESALRQQKWPEAAARMKKSLELNPNFDQAMTGLAHALVEQGNTAEAGQWLGKALEYNPQNYRALYELGGIKSKTDKAAAIANLEKAASIQPNFAPLRRDLGVLQFEQKNYTEAAKHLAAAVQLGVEEAKILNFLGISYSQNHRLQDGIESYQRALKLDPDLAEAHLNLGFAYQQLGRKQAAHEQYVEACRLNEKFCAYASKTSR